MASQTRAQDEGTKLTETAGSRFVDECKQLLSGERYTDLLGRFAAQLDVLFSKAADDQGARLVPAGAARCR